MTSMTSTPANHAEAVAAATAKAVQSTRDHLPMKTPLPHLQDKKEEKAQAVISRGETRPSHPAVAVGAVAVEVAFNQNPSGSFGFFVLLSKVKNNGLLVRIAQTHVRLFL